MAAGLLLATAMAAAAPGFAPAPLPRRGMTPPRAFPEGSWISHDLQISATFYEGGKCLVARGRVLLCGTWRRCTEYGPHEGDLVACVLCREGGLAPVYYAVYAVRLGLPNWPKDKTEARILVDLESGETLWPDE